MKSTRKIYCAQNLVFLFFSHCFYKSNKGKSFLIFLSFLFHMFQTKPKGFLAVPKPIQNKKTKESFVGNYLPDFTFIVNTLRREKTIRTSNGSNPKEKKQRKFPQNSHWTVESDEQTDSSFWHRQYSFLRCLMGLLKYLGGGWEFGFMVYVFGKGICASRSSPRNV